MNFNIFVSHPSYLRLLQLWKLFLFFVVLQKIYYTKQAVYLCVCIGTVQYWLLSICVITCIIILYQIITWMVHDTLKLSPFHSGSVTRADGDVEGNACVWSDISKHCPYNWHNIFCVSIGVKTCQGIVTFSDLGGLCYPFTSFMIPYMGCHILQVS